MALEASKVMAVLKSDIAVSSLANLSYTCVAVCCSVLQCVAVCCSVLQCDIPVTCHIPVRTYHTPLLRNGGLFCRDVGLFCRDVRLFCGDVGLFCGDVGLFCGDVAVLDFLAAFVIYVVHSDELCCVVHSDADELCGAF